MWQEQDRLVLGTEKGADVGAPMGILLDRHACCMVHCLAHLRGWAAVGLPQPHHMELHHLGTVNYSDEASILQKADELSNNLPAIPYTEVMRESKNKRLP